MSTAQLLRSNYAREKELGRIARMEREVCDAYGCLYVPNMQIDVKPNRLPPFWDETDHPNRAGNEQVALRLLPALRLTLARATR